MNTSSYADHSLEECYAAIDRANRDGVELLADELFNLAMALEDGQYGLARDHERAVRLCTEAAGRGHVLACTAVARLNFSDGRLSDECVRWLECGIEAGSVECAFRLGFAIMQDRAKGTDERSFALLESTAMRMFPSGLGFMAFYWLDKEGAASVKTRMFAALSLMFGQKMVEEHVNDFFTEADTRPDGGIDLQAVIIAAAKEGEPLAMYAQYMFMVSEEDGSFKEDTEQSLALLRRCAEAGVPDAMERMATTAIGNSDYDEANLWLHRVEPLNMPEAMFTGGLMEINGDRRPRNTEHGISEVVRALGFGLPNVRMCVSALVDGHLLDDPYGCRADYYRHMSLIQ